jgi:hypothetical protein
MTQHQAIQYQATQQLHETVQAKAKELGLKVEITGDYTFSIVKHKNFNKQILESVFLSHGVKEDKCISGQETMLNVVSVQSITLIEEPQLKQIFVAFEEKLGENPVSRSFKLGADMWVHSKGKRKDCEVAYERYYFLPKSQAEALYQKYCYDYPESGFKKDPVKALLEVNEIIKNLK